MKQLLMALSILVATTTAIAQGQQLQKPKQGGPCSNIAKYGAMRAYRAHNAPTGGDLNIAAFLTAKTDAQYTYTVSVDEVFDDRGDDGFVSATYVVRVTALENGQCLVGSVEDSLNP